MSAKDVNHDENIARQLEEIDALQAIYGEDFYPTHPDSKTCEMWIKHQTNPKYSTCLNIFFPDNYPSNGELVLEIVSFWMTARDCEEMAGKFQEIFNENVGEIVLFQCIEKFREFVNEKLAERYVPEESSSEDLESNANSKLDTSEENQNFCLPGDNEFTHIEIMHGEPITDRKSTFQGHLALISSRDQADQVLAKLKSNRKIGNATHNAMAYRIYNKENNAYIQDCDDDGETAAGSRLLHLLQITDAKNVIVVISRWYGGLLLGPDRFKHFNNCARDLLQVAGLIENKATADQKESKGKGKAKAKKHK